MLKNKELQCVRARLKPCARQLYPSRLHAITQANKYNLYLTFAPFCVHVNQDEPWSTKGYRSDSGHVVAYFSFDENLTNLAAKAELDNNHGLLGTYLGYPACCVNYFSRVFNEHNTDPVHKFTHYLLSYRDREEQNIFHYPCSPYCPESIKIARLTLNF